MLQMSVVLAGMVMAGVLIIYKLPEEIGLKESLHIAGKMGKINLIDWKFDLNNRYNIWSGIIGGFFLQLSYFGTDQSQVGRYLTGQTASESKKGLLLNGFLKIPMQFFILLVGILVFVFYQFNEPPMFFNRNSEAKWVATKGYEKFETEKSAIFQAKKNLDVQLVRSLDNPEETYKIKNELQKLQARQDEVRKDAVAYINKNEQKIEPQDTNYIFLRFIIDQLPVGIVGFLIAMILLASMGSMASAFGSLTSTSMVDIYQRFLNKNSTNKHYWIVSKLITLGWGILCLIVAQFAVNMGSLIEVVNILGSWFYGTILGVFLCAFYLPKTKGNHVFWAALLAEAFVIYAWKVDLMAFLWLNVLGCLLVMIFSLILQNISSLYQRISSPDN
jgi:Na+/proline symporter